MPCGQKKSTSEMIQSQTVTPPLAAMEGTTLRLKTATTKSKTRSHRPSTRRRCGTSCVAGAVIVASIAKFLLPQDSRRGIAGGCENWKAGPKPGLYIVTLVTRRADECEAAFLLRFRECGRDFLKHDEVLVNVGFRMLNGDGPLLVPPIGLREYPAIDHAEPVVAPEIDIDLGPVAVVLNFLWIQHQGAVDARARNVSLQTGFFDDGAIALGKILAEFADVHIILARQDFTERRQARGHCHTIRVVGAAGEAFVLRNQLHHRAARSEGSQRQTAADGLGQADHVRLHAKKVARAAPRELGAGFHFVKNQQRTIRGANIAQPLQKAGLRQAQSDVHQDGLENDGGDLAGILLEAILDALQIVEAGDGNNLERSFRHATAAGNGIGRIRIAVVSLLGLDADKRSVMQSVVRAFELQNLVATRGGARDAAGVHGDFRAAGAESHHIDRIALANFFRKLPFLLVGHAEGCAFMQFLFDGLYHGVVAKPPHPRPVAQGVINVLVAIDVMNAAAFAILDKNRVRLVVPVIAGNPKRDAFQSTLVRRG